MSKYFKQNTLFCFSPPVMIATFIIEISLAIHILLTRKLNRAVGLAIVLIVLLAVFQFAEFGVCESFGIRGIVGSKLGFAAITFLPPLGLHLVLAIAKKRQRILLTISYAGAVIWTYLFSFGKILGASVCKPNYVIFNIANPYEGWYYIYYDLFLVIAVGTALYYMRHSIPRIKKALMFIVLGYSSFIFPSMAFTLIDDYVGVDSTMPSIMCGFAVILALLISFGSVTNISKKKG